MRSHTLPPFQIRLPSKTIAVREALAAIRRALAPLGLEEEEHGTVEIVLAEVLNNIVEHANGPHGETGTIDIHCACKCDGLHLKITDHGRAMPNGARPAGASAHLAVDLEDLPEGGFGWCLIEDLAEDIHYKRMKGCNQLDLRLPVGLAS